MQQAEDREQEVRPRADLTDVAATWKGCLCTRNEAGQGDDWCFCFTAVDNPFVCIFRLVSASALYFFQGRLLFIVWLLIKDIYFLIACEFLKIILLTCWTWS